MMRRLKNTTLILLFSTGFCFAQHNFLDYPKFSEDELKKASSEIDKSAPAEILYNSIRYNIEGLSAEKTFFSKIKIYDRKRAEQWLNIEIPVSTGAQLTDFIVYVYNYKNGKVEKASYNKNEQLKENFVKGLKFYKLAIPDVSDGAVIEYSYKIDAGIFGLDYFVEYDVPVVYQEYNLEYHDGVNFKFNGAGSLLQPEYRVSKIESRLGRNFNIERYGFLNTKPLAKEKYLKDPDRFRKRIKPEITKYSYKYTTFTMPNSWNEIAKGLNEGDNFGGFLRSSSKDLLPDNISNTVNSEERANKIFDFVKTNFKWNKSFGIVSTQGYKKLLKTKSGNTADLNLLLVNLFNNAGLEANPFIISTVDNGILNILSPNILSVNSVLATVKINGQLYFYDATSYNSKANILPKQDWNDFGILIEGDKATDLSFSNTNISHKRLIVKSKLDIENSQISGDFSHSETGLYAIDAYDNFDFNQNRYNENFKTDYSINTKKIETKKIDSGEMITKIDFTDNNNIDIVGSKIIFNPLLFLKGKNEEFDQKEERQNQIDFISPFIRSKNVEIEIPDGYAIESLPKPKQTRTNDKELSFKYNCELKGNILYVTSEINVASDSYPKEYYPVFKQIWKTISDTENQVVSLIKK